MRKVFFSVLPVQIASQLVVYLHSMLDSVFVGQFVGEAGLAVIGLAAPVSLAVSTLGAVLASGSQYLCGSAVGRGDKKNVRHSFSAGIVLAAVCGLLLAAAVFFLSFTNVFPVIFGAADETLASELCGYLRGMCYGFPFAVLYPVMLEFLQLSGHRHRAMTTTVSLVVVKVAGDALALFVLQNGMFGVGLATALSYFAAIVVGLLCFVSEKGAFSLRHLSFPLRTTGTLIHMGLPGGLQPLSSLVLVWLFNTQALRCGGTTVVSILTVAMNTCEFFFVFVVPASNAAGVLISVFGGSRDRTSVKSVCTVSLITGWVLTAASTLLLIPLGRPFALLYGLQGASADIAAHASLYMVTCGFVAWSRLLPSAVYMGLGNVRRASVYGIFGYLLIPCLTVLVLPTLFGLNGLWLCYAAYDLLTAIVFLIYDAVKLRRLPLKLSEWVYLPHSFGVPHEQRLDITVKNAAEITGVSERVVAFCRKRNLDSRRSYYAGLCAEEMVASVFEHNAPVPARLSAQVRVAEENGTLLLTFWDNGKPFAPVDYPALAQNDDPTKNIGIRIVAGIAKDIHYTAPLGLNCLTVSL